MRTAKNFISPQTLTGSGKSKHSTTARYTALCVKYFCDIKQYPKPNLISNWDPARSVENSSERTVGGVFLEYVQSLRHSGFSLDIKRWETKPAPHKRTETPSCTLITSRAPLQTSLPWLWLTGTGWWHHKEHYVWYWEIHDITTVIQRTTGE